MRPSPDPHRVSLRIMRSFEFILPGSPLFATAEVPAAPPLRVGRAGRIIRNSRRQTSVPLLGQVVTLPIPTAAVERPSGSARGTFATAWSPVAGSDGG